MNLMWPFEYCDFGATGNFLVPFAKKAFSEGILLRDKFKCAHCMFVAVFNGKRVGRPENAQAIGRFDLLEVAVEVLVSGEAKNHFRERTAASAHPAL